MSKYQKALQILTHLPIDLWQLLVTYLPGEVGFYLRYQFWKRKLKFLGKKARIDVNAHFQNPKFISLGENCWIDRNVLIIAGPPFIERITFFKENSDFLLDAGNVYIGKNTHIAPNCVLNGMGGLYIGKNSGVASNSNIYSFSHHYRNLSDRNDNNQYSFTPLAHPDQQSMISGPVFIGDFAAIGSGSVILPGTSLKRGCWVACGSVVSGSFTEQSLISTTQDTLIKSIANLMIKE